MAGDPLTDVAKAIVDKWATITDIATLAPGGLHEGPLDPPGTKPYASFTVEQDRGGEYSSSGDWIDYQRVTIELYGIGKKAIGDVVASVKVGLEAGTLTIANADFMRLEVLPGWSNRRESKKGGDDYRKATLRYCVWSHRRG